MIITVAATLLIGLLLAILIYACSEWFGWKKRLYTDVPARATNKLVKLGDFHSRNADIDMEVKTHLHGKRIVFEDLSDDEEIEDDLLDYKDQLKVEAFNTETLYDMLTEEVVKTADAVGDHEKRSNQVYYQTQADTDALKMIWKAKMNNSTVKDIEDNVVESEMSKINAEITRRRDIGEACYAKLSSIVSQMTRKVKKCDVSLESVMAAVEEALHLAQMTDVIEKTLIKSRFHRLIEMLEDMRSQLDVSPVQFYQIFNESTNSPCRKDEIFNNTGVLLRPDLISVDKSSGLRTPKQTVTLIDSNGDTVPVSSIPDKLVISPSTGRVYKAQGSLLFDPGRLRIVVFDEFTTKVSDLDLIPFHQVSGDYEIPTLPDASHFRLMHRIVDPKTGLHCPILGACLINDDLAPIAGSSKSLITGQQTACEPFCPKSENDVAQFYQISSQGSIESSDTTMADHGHFVTQRIISQIQSIIDSLNMIARTKFSGSKKNGTEHIRPVELIKTEKENFLNAQERLKMFRLEQTLIAIEQLQAYDWLRTSGGVVGQLNYRESGQLLPILIGWKLDGDHILNVYHDFDENKDYALTLPDKEIGSDTVDNLGRPGKLIGLEWNKKESKVDPIVQVGQVRAPQKNNFVNVFETEFAERMKAVIKSLSLAETSKGEVFITYKMVLNEIINRSLSTELDEYCSELVSDQSKKIDRSVQLESSRKATKLAGLKSCLSKSIIDVLTGSDLDNDKACNVLTNGFKKWTTSISKYHTKFSEEKTRFSERQWEIEGSEDYNQKRIVEQRHEANKDRIVLEYYDQLVIRIHTTLASVNKLQISLIESRVRAQLAKKLVRGTFAPLTGIMDVSQLKTSSPTTGRFHSSAILYCFKLF